MMKVFPRGYVAIASTLLCACAQTSNDAPPSLLNDPALAPGAPSNVYQLTAAERKYDCKKLTGVMQVRILQVRAQNQREDSSAAARGMQGVVRPIFGGTTAGENPDADLSRDLAMLEAYNTQLAAKKCKTFDLAAELKKTDPKDLPRPR